MPGGTALALAVPRRTIELSCYGVQAFDSFEMVLGMRVMLAVLARVPPPHSRYASLIYARAFSAGGVLAFSARTL
jgi:hypothetical protein